jgi:small-conductance mechanosensitive channel
VEDVLREPAPQVRLRDFGDSAINFDLLVWIREPHNHQQIRSKVSFEILKAFARQGIEIPFPQRQVWLGSKPPDARPE